eukprot:TRINITY_DN2545_c0_g1_i1.p3 TRINITY_DN2545_c0_g1~~TRINITY_DN2545_c0_g1_i1.p3  ORF type:complete len:131 (+),score=6.08 TRINITY_DN2545_c0_g1_i1:283-675(+)
MVVDAKICQDPLRQQASYHSLKDCNYNIFIQQNNNNMTLFLQIYQSTNANISKALNIQLVCMYVQIQLFYIGYFVNQLCRFQLSILQVFACIFHKYLLFVVCDIFFVGNQQWDMHDSNNGQNQLASLKYT